MTTHVESFDDIVFENRNKEYGAYELRKRYSKRGSIALGVSLFVLLVAVGVPLIASILKQRNYNRYLEKQTTIEMEKVKVERDEIKPPPPPPPPPATKAVAFTPPKIVDSVKEEVEILGNDELSNKITNTPVDTTTKEVEIVEVKEEVVEQVVESYAVQEKPSFPGGDAELMKYIAQNIKYPVIAQENGVEGTVYVRFVVEKNGSIGEAQIMRKADPLLDEEALRVVKTLPTWSPGKNNGNPVRVWFIVPIKFKLE